MNEQTLSRVVDCISETTRYPKKLLNVDADIESDLGIDSVKRVEIVIALGEEFGLDLASQSTDPTVRTIGDLSNWVESQLQQSASEEPRPSQTAPPQATPPQTAPPQGAPPQAAPPQAAPSQGTPPQAAPRRAMPQSEPRYTQQRPASMPVPTPHYGSTRSATLPENTPKPLEGRFALVTGSGRGIGQTTARVLAARGATVIVNSFHSREKGEQTALEIREQGGSAVHLWGSVASPEHVDAIFTQIEKEFGCLDILVCNASDGRIGPFLELSADDWDRAFRTNVSGHYQCAIRAAKLMRGRGGGSIVTMSAIGAHQFVSGLGSQGVAKAAVESLTRYLACELGPSGVRVNCVAAGPVYGELISKFPSARAAQDHWESITPDGMLCSPLDIASTIAFLVSEQASGINGAVWSVDHGFSANAPGQQPRSQFVGPANIRNLDVPTMPQSEEV